MDLIMSNSQIYSIIERFYTRFKYKNSFKIKHPLPEINDIQLIKAYIRDCIYTNEVNFIKQNAIIKYRLTNHFNQEIICLNILWEDYKDLMKENKL